MPPFKSFVTHFASCTPSQILTNADLEKKIDTSADWIVERTGIQSRHIADQNEYSLDLAIRSARETLEKSQLRPDEIDGVIIGTSSHHHVFPALACELIGALGLKKAFGFDIHAACTGFVYALHTANQFIANGNYQNILVIGVDTVSKAVDWTDRKTCILFGDGAGSCIASKVDASFPQGLHVSSISCDYDEDFSLYLNNPSIRPNQEQYIKMDGQKVFKKAVIHMSDTLEKLLETLNMKSHELDWIIPHQANARIIQAVAERLGVDLAKCYQCVQRYGNTSAASIPLAIVDAQRAGLLLPGQKIAVVAFGGGLTYGGAILTI